MAAQKIYQFKVTLRGFRPPIWRRFQVYDDITFYELHAVIQITMGWLNDHLHMFDVGGLYITDAETLDSGWDDGEDEDQARIATYLRKEGDKIRYEYDFGDSWEHDVLLEKILPPEAGVHYPRCIKGRRACPPEDIGGVWGYAEFLEAVGDVNHAEHENYTEWYGDDFDAEAFDLDGINEMLQQL